MQAKVRVRLLQKALTSEGKSSPEIVEEKNHLIITELPILFEIIIIKLL
jgi:hypothetical protein